MGSTASCQHKPKIAISACLLGAEVRFNGGHKESRLCSRTLAEHFGTINAANLKRAHALLESGKARGKIVLEGF